METITELPSWRQVLAVVAHPDDESFGLGAVVGRFVDAGAQVDVLCFTHGEASTLHGVPGDLATIRETELREAGSLLGVTHTTLLSYPDMGLAPVGAEVLSKDVEALSVEADGLLVFDVTGITGHPDHQTATAAAVLAAGRLDIPVLAWTLPETVASALREETGAPFAGRRADQITHVVRVDRARQRTASLAHASQALPTSVLWRRLELLGDVEHLRLL